MRPERFLAAIVVAVTMLTSVGCQDACTTLAEFICSCEPNRREEDSCLQAVRAGRSRSITQVELAVCETRLDTCTCGALEDNNLAACGLAAEEP